MKIKSIKIILVSLAVFLIMPIIAFAEEPPSEPLIPGRIEGTGTYFEITDSEYLNISLQSPEEITILLESIPKTISLYIEASTSTTSTILTIGNLELNKIYYKFEDSYKNKVVFVSDENGDYSWTQDLTKPHHIWIQPEDNGTIFLPKDCTNYGTWDELTSTCTLTQDLTQSVEITIDDIILDCGGHKVTSTETGFGIYLYQKNNVVIQNCTVKNFTEGIRIVYSTANKILKNNALENVIGISMLDSSYNEIIKNHASSNIYIGLYLGGSTKNNLIENEISDNKRIGLLLYGPNNYLRNNSMHNNKYNFGVWTLLGAAQDIDTSNTANGRPIYYLVNEKDKVIDATLNPGYIGVIKSENITIKDVTINKNLQGILFDRTMNSRIENVNLSENMYGIEMNGSSSNQIVGNKISGNRIGIRLWVSSYNTFTENNFLYDSFYFTGTLEVWSHHNKVYHNNFKDHPAPHTLRSYRDLFDDGYPSGGNYWSRYDSPEEGCIDEKRGPNQDIEGSDGICDAPYTFYGGKDRYPFVEKDGWKIPVPEKMIRPVEGYFVSPKGRFDFKDDKGYPNHRGIDIERKFVGQSVLAPADGEVVFVKREITDKAGLWVWIWHGEVVALDGSIQEKISTRYLHLDKISEGIVPGAKVFRGETIIGTVGKTGSNFWDEPATPAHLHFEIWQGGNPESIIEALKTPTKPGKVWNQDTEAGRSIQVLNPLRFVTYEDKPKRLTIAVESPVDLTVTDPDGFIVSKEINELPTIARYFEYEVEEGAPGAEFITIDNRKIGDYLISVIPEPDALPTDKYTLEAFTDGLTAILAKDVLISDIPRAPYILRSTEQEIIPIIPAFVDFDPDTLNLKSKGKWVTVYIELPVGYNINEIDLESIRLNGIRVEVKPIQVGDYDDNNIPDLMVKFDGSTVRSILKAGDKVKITISGKLIDKRSFEGSDIIKAISPSVKNIIILLPLQ